MRVKFTIALEGFSYHSITTHEEGNASHLYPLPFFFSAYELTYFIIIFPKINVPSKCKLAIRHKFQIHLFPD
jgi:hypothetical protein